MYSSDFGVVSDGQLHNMERELMRREERAEEPETYESAKRRGNDAGLLSSLISGIKTDDLILIALGVLLLLDGKSDNDLLAVILIVLFLI